MSIGTSPCTLTVDRSRKSIYQGRDLNYFRQLLTVTMLGSNLPNAGNIMLFVLHLQQ